MSRNIFASANTGDLRLSDRLASECLGLYRWRRDELRDLASGAFQARLVHSSRGADANGNPDTGRVADRVPGRLELGLRTLQAPHGRT
jgi:hypothetical protein